MRHCERPARPTHSYTPTMARSSDKEDRQQALRLLREGWHSNVTAGSVTRTRDQRSGLIDNTVWLAMKEIQAEDAAWTGTLPQPLSPSSVSE